VERRWASGEVRPKGGSRAVQKQARSSRQDGPFSNRQIGGTTPQELAFRDEARKEKMSEEMVTVIGGN